MSVLLSNSILSCRKSWYIIIEVSQILVPENTILPKLFGDESACWGGRSVRRKYTAFVVALEMYVILVTVHCNVGGLKF